MSLSRCSIASLLVCCLLLALAATTFAEYDILTRYDVSRPEGGRHFWLYSPTNYSLTNNSLPLIFFFHGFSDQCELQGYISQFSIWAYVAEVHQYHIAVMCGTNPGPGWNSGGDPSRPDDIAYTRASLAIIKKSVNVRDGHVFAMGHSNGAMMSETLACNASDIINAIASNAGTTLMGPSINASLAYCTAAYGNSHTSILKIHGTADQAVIYNGTTSFPGAVADLYAWAARNGCQGNAQPQWTRGIASAQGWQQCNGGTEVELVSLWKVNHQWMITSDFRSSDYVFLFFNRVAKQQQEYKRLQQQKQQLQRPQRSSFLNFLRTAM